MTEKLDGTSSENEGEQEYKEISCEEIATENRMIILENDILDFLSQNNEIFFKSQQIDDPELTVDEKRVIAKDILEQDHGKFLSRFGKYLQSEHLNYFDENNRNEEHYQKQQKMDSENDESYEVKFLVANLRKDLENRHKIIKNRRYSAMQAMIKENDYFSEKEMMQREPYLYEQLVGQYLTESEKRARDSYDPKNTLFSKIIFDTIDKEHMDELCKKQENEERICDNEEEDCSRYSIEESCLSMTMMSESSNSDEDSLPETLQQWGNFENEPKDSQKEGTAYGNVKEKISYKKNKQKHRYQQQQRKCITDGEREMLKQEFVGIMYSKFLEGEDEDFDYSKVDNNADLDDLKQINQDNEDEYFDANDDTDYENVTDIRRMNDSFESEDELDVYMKHLNRHPVLQNQQKL